MSSVFPIKYGGDECAYCGGALEVGQSATYTEDGVVHFTCPPARPCQPLRVT